MKGSGVAGSLLLAALLLLSGAPTTPCAVAAPAPGANAAPDARLRALEAEIKRRESEREQARLAADKLAKELEAVQGDMVAAAKAVQEHEESLSDLERRLGEVTLLEKAKNGDLILRRHQINGVLIALERLAARPSEALIAQPTSPADTVRSAILLREVLPRINEEAVKLKIEIEQVSELRADIARQRKSISALGAKLAAEHRRLSALFEKKRALRSSAESRQAETERRLAQMADEARDLKDLMAKLEAEAKEREKREREEAAARQKEQEAEEARLRAAAAQSRTAPAAKPAPAAPRDKPALAAFSAGRGKMPYPARGRILTRFNDKIGTQNARGVTIQTRMDAQIVAPWEGQIVFAGPFRGYGLLLIIEHSEGYHTLLSGMARIDGKAGQHLAVGEPVGVMGRADDAPSLYFELRHQGQSVDPLPWLTARNTRVSG